MLGWFSLEAVGCAVLQDLSLTNTTVSGQLHALENATELHNVYLDDSRTRKGLNNAEKTIR